MTGRMSSMKILVLGAGRMGYGAAFDLVHNSPDVDAVTVADFRSQKGAGSRGKGRDFSASKPSRSTPRNYDAVVELMHGHDSAISCVNYWYNESPLEGGDRDAARISAISAATITSSTSSSRWMPKRRPAGINIIPDCGLAPGMVSILAMHGAAKFDASTRSTSASAACRRIRSRRSIINSSSRSKA